MIERSRVRHNYPRPWGLCIPIRKKKNPDSPASAETSQQDFNDSDDEGLDLDAEEKDVEISQLEERDATEKIEVGNLSDDVDHRGIRVNEQN